MTSGERGTWCGLAVENLKLSETNILMIEGAVDRLYGPQKSIEHRRAWGSLKKFSLFLIDDADRKSAGFDPNILRRYHAWLVSQSAFSSATKYVHFRVVARIFGYCYRNYPKEFPEGLEKVVGRFEGTIKNKREPLSEDVSKNIVRVLHNELANIEQRLSRGLAIRSGVVSSSEDKKCYDLLQKLFEFSDGQQITAKRVKTWGRRLRSEVKEIGGLSSIMDLIYPTQYDILVFYLIILFQLAGNPESILFMKTDCLVEHSLRDDRIWVKWDKPRAGREQRSNFPKKKEFGAPRIIERLISYTANLRMLMDVGEKDCVFVAASRYGVGVPKPSQLHLLLAKFIKNYNLPKFTFAQLRKTSAVLHHKAGQSVIAAKQKLNHLSIASTFRYTTFVDREEEHQLAIYEAQQQLIADALEGPRERSIESRHDEVPSVPADTVFGFKCIDPTGPHAHPARPGGVCVSFSRCATCPGALVPLDQPRVVAALYSSRDFLLRERDRAAREGWQERFLVLYAPTLAAIENELLPKVTRGVLEAAIKLTSLNPLPPLE